jgi:hypothetical protein
MFRRLTAFLSVVALANPLCCCWAEGIAFEPAEKAANHACCESSDSGSELPTEEDGGSHSCPHESGAWLAAEVQSWNLVVSIPHTVDAALYQVTGSDQQKHHLSGKIRTRCDGYRERHPPPFSAFCSYLI